MSSMGRSIWTVTLLLMLGAVALCWQQHQAAVALRLENQQFRAQALAESRLAAENARLSNSLAQLRGAQGLDNGEMRELLRLRAEVKALKGQGTLAATELPAAKAAPKPVLAAVTEAPRPIPKEEWAFSGYASPEAALQSVAWAMSTGDVKTFLAALTPEGLQFMEKQFDGKTETEIAAILTEEIAQTKVLRFERKPDSTASRVTFVLASKEQENGTERTRDEQLVTLKSVGPEWRMTGAPEE
jgi:hypothetical protein